MELELTARYDQHPESVTVNLFPFSYRKRSKRLRAKPQRLPVLTIKYPRHRRMKYHYTVADYAPAELVANDSDEATMEITYDRSAFRFQPMV